MKQERSVRFDGKLTLPRTQKTRATQENAEIPKFSVEKIDARRHVLLSGRRP
jgi:hypothetical protein